jgi:hypothetical protein
MPTICNNNHCYQEYIAAVQARGRLQKMLPESETTAQVVNIISNPTLSVVKIKIG